MGYGLVEQSNLRTILGFDRSGLKKGMNQATRTDINPSQASPEHVEEGMEKHSTCVEKRCVYGELPKWEKCVSEVMG